jgi:RND family efflux transporter MFP subunit
MKPMVFAVVAVLPAVLFSGCGGRDVGAAAPENPAESAAPVAVARIARHNLARELELASEFRPYQEIDLHAKVSGYLKTISVDVGDRVRKGQLLAELEIPEMAQDLAQASATVKRTALEVNRARGEMQRAEATLSFRKVSYERLESVAKARPGLIARQEIDDAAARLAEASAQLDAARAGLAASEEAVRAVTATQERTSTMIAYTRITAPFSGIITQRGADVGALVQAGTSSQAPPLVRLSEVDVLRLILPVPEAVVSRIRLGSSVEVRVDTLNRVIQGRVARFNGRLDANTRTMETEVDIANPDNAIKPGMFGYAKLRLDRRQNAIAAPVQSVRGAVGSRTVLVVGEGKRLEERPVETGLETPSLIEITSNLREGDLVVVGSRSHKPGARVEPKLVEAAGSGGH